MMPPDQPGPHVPRPGGASRVRRFLLGTAAVLCIAGCLLVLPCAQKVRNGEGWLYSQISLKQIGLALENYYEANKKLPPAVVRDKDGRPLYSWRVLLLPYLEQDAVFKQFKPDEPWDGPQNKKLLEKTPPCYLPLGGSADPPGLTRYQVFVGPGTAFERQGLRWKDFPDGRADTILVVEAGEPVPWSKPADLVYDPGGPLPPLGAGFGKAVHFLCYEVGRKTGINALFADGSVRFLRATADEAAVRGLITRNGGEKVDWSKLE